MYILYIQCIYIYVYMYIYIYIRIYPNLSESQAGEAVSRDAQSLRLGVQLRTNGSSSTARGDMAIATICG